MSGRKGKRTMKLRNYINNICLILFNNKFFLIK